LVGIARIDRGRGHHRDPDRDAKAEAIAGRLENLVIGRSHEFASGAELLDSIARDLEASVEKSSSDA
jgi:hypothetical protein